MTIYQSRVKEECQNDAEIRALAAKIVQLNQKKPISSVPPNNGRIIQNNCHNRSSILCYFPKLSDKGEEMVSTEPNPQNNTAVQDDGPSVAGKFSWTIVGKTIVPVITKLDGTKYVSVRIAESKVLSHFFQRLNTEVFNCVSVKSFSISEAETRLLNEINSRHSEFHFGKDAFNIDSDFIVKLDDLVEFYTFMETCFNKLTHAPSNGASKCGFVRINDDSVVPYAVKNGQQYVPLFYFEGETESLKTKAINLENWDLAYLKFCCKVQGIKNELFASEQCQVTSLEDVKSYFPEGTKFDEYWPTKLLDMQTPARNDVNGNLSWVQTPHVENSNVAQSTVPNNHSMVNKAPQMSALQKQLHSAPQRVNSTAVINNGTTNMAMYPATATTWQQQIGATSNAVISQPYQVGPQTTQVYHQSRVVQKQPSAGNIHTMSTNPTVVMTSRSYPVGQQPRPHVQPFYSNANTVPTGTVVSQQPPPLVRVTAANSLPNTYTAAVSGGQNDTYSHVFQSSASLPAIYQNAPHGLNNKNLRSSGSVHGGQSATSVQVQNNPRYPPALTPISATGVLTSNNCMPGAVNPSAAQQQQQQAAALNSRNHRAPAVAPNYVQNGGEIIDLSSPPHSPQSTTNSIKRSAVVTNNVADYRTLNFNYPPLVRIDDVPAHQLKSINPPFKARTIQFKEKTVLAMNLKPFDYDNYVLTLPDVISNYFPRSDVNRIRHVLQNMFKITLYKGNVQQMQLLQSHHKNKSLNDEVPLIELKDLEHYYTPN